MFLRRKMYWAVAVVLVVAAAGVIVGGWIGSERAIHPKSEVDNYKLSQFNLPVEDVSFKSPDRLTLAGWFIPGTRGATVILVHGIESNRTAMLPHADYLYRSGFSVLMFDLRHRGESEGDESTLGAKEPWDIEGAVEYLKRRPDVDPEHIGVQGISLGAVSAILAAAETPEIRGVVAEIPFASVSSVMGHAFRRITGLPGFPFAPVSKFIGELRLGVDLDAVAAVKTIDKISPRPVFLIDELEDALFPSDSVELLYKAAREPKELWQIPGAPHAKGWQTAPEEYERRVLAFWRQSLGQPHPRSN